MLNLGFHEFIFTRTRAYYSLVALFAQASIFSNFEPQGKSLHETYTFYSKKDPNIFAGRLRSVINRCGGGSREHALPGLSAFISENFHFLPMNTQVEKRGG